MEITGVALTTGTTRGMSGIQREWPAEVLEEAADSLCGKPIEEKTATGYSNNVIGAVKDAYYEEGIGVIYEGEIIDEEIAKKVKNNLAEVAPSLMVDGEFVDDNDDKQVVESAEFDSLFICPEAEDQVPGRIGLDGNLAPKGLTFEIDE